MKRNITLTSIVLLMSMQWAAAQTDKLRMSDLREINFKVVKLIGQYETYSAFSGPEDYADFRKLFTSSDASLYCDVLHDAKLDDYVKLTEYLDIVKKNYTDVGTVVNLRKISLPAFSGNTGSIDVEIIKMVNGINTCKVSYNDTFNLLVKVSFQASGGLFQHFTISGINTLAPKGKLIVLKALNPKGKSVPNEPFTINDIRYATDNKGNINYRYKNQDKPLIINPLNKEYAAIQFEDFADLLSHGKTASTPCEQHSVAFTLQKTTAALATVTAAERKKAEKERLAKETAEKEKAAADKLALEKAAKEKAEIARLAKEKEELEKAALAKAELEKAVLEKAEKEKAELAKAEQEKAAQKKAALAKAEKEKLAKQKAEKAKPALTKAEQEKIAREKAEKEKAELAKAEQEKLAREKAESEQAELARLEQEKKDKEKAEEQRKELARQEELKKAKEIKPVARKVPAYAKFPVGIAVNYLLPSSGGPVTKNIELLQNEISSDFSLGYGIFAGYEFKLGQLGKFQLKTGLMIDNINFTSELEHYSVNYTDIDPDNYTYLRKIDINNISEEIKLRYLSIPVGIEKIFTLGNSGWALSLDAGINLMFLSSATYSSSADALYAGYYPELFNLTIKENGVYDFGNYAVDASGDIKATSSLLSTDLGAGLYKALGENLSVFAKFRHRTMNSDVFEVNDLRSLSEKYSQIESMMNYKNSYNLRYNFLTVGMAFNL